MEDDELIEQYKTIVEQAVEISSNVAANPEKFNDKFWQFQTLMENLYGKKVYMNHSTKGQDGIFVLFTEYVDLKRDVMKNGGYEHLLSRGELVGADHVEGNEERCANRNGKGENQSNNTEKGFENDIANGILRLCDPLSFCADDRCGIGGVGLNGLLIMILIH
jgi:hypothetical protein